MQPLEFLPASQRHELTKLRVLQLLSDPAIAEHGLSAARIIKEVCVGGNEGPQRKLLKEMEAEGLIEHKTVDENKSFQPLFITTSGREHLAAAKERALFPEIGQRQDWVTEALQHRDAYHERLAEMYRRQAALPASSEDRKLLVLQVLSSSANVEYGSSAKVIEVETGIPTLPPLLKAMEAEGLIERKHDPHNKSAKSVFITAQGIEHLAATKERGRFPKIGQRQVGLEPEPGGDAHQTLVEFIRNLPEFQGSRVARIREVAGQLQRLIENWSHGPTPPDSDPIPVEARKGRF